MRSGVRLDCLTTLLSTKPHKRDDRVVLYIPRRQQRKRLCSEDKLSELEETGNFVIVGENFSILQVLPDRLNDSELMFRVCFASP